MFSVYVIHLLCFLVAPNFTQAWALIILHSLFFLYSIEWSLLYIKLLSIFSYFRWTIQYAFSTAHTLFFYDAKIDHFFSFMLPLLFQHCLQPNGANVFLNRFRFYLTCPFGILSSCNFLFNAHLCCIDLWILHIQPNHYWNELFGRNKNMALFSCLNCGVLYPSYCFYGITCWSLSPGSFTAFFAQSISCQDMSA